MHIWTCEDSNRLENIHQVLSLNSVMENFFIKVCNSLLNIAFYSLILFLKKHDTYVK